MRLMILDSSSEYLIVTFKEEQEVIYESITVGRNNHSDNLLKTIKEGLFEKNLEVKDFDAIICGVGPGAYTGVRVSLTVAKMFCWTLNKPLYIASSLDLMASKYFKESDKIIAINMHAKKGYVYHKIIKVNNGDITELEKEAFLSVEDAKLIDDKYDVDYLVNNSNIAYSSLNVDTSKLEVAKNIELLEPNYLREGI